jgi:hypothetical protein
VSTDAPRRTAIRRRWATEIPVRDDIRELSRFPVTDYADSFQVKADNAARSAEQWARAMFEGAPVGLRTFLVRTWPLFGVRLGPLHSAGYVLGWRILKSTPDFVVLQASSGAGVTVRLVVMADGATVLAGTFVRCKGLFGRAVWFGIAPIYRLVVSRLLGEATR